jgi:hypothetical protein
MHQPKEKPFSQVYNDAYRDNSVSFEARSLAVLIGTYTNAEGLAWPGGPLLHRLTGWAEGTVKKYRSQAVHAGLLKKEFMHDDAGRFAGVAYRVSPRLLRPPLLRPRDGRKRGPT